ncbi:hypothetical protein IT411_00430 [Candidatus Peregrinibacteria bacterium]|nr:hypothetical protein [Candidatus Peregrinibacteria bacterium]
MLHPIWNPFSKYADGFEKKVDRLLRSSNVMGIFEAQRRVSELMQEDVIKLNLWLEARFKGYRYLSRGARKRMYANTEARTEEFKRYVATATVHEEAIIANLKHLELPIPSLPGDMDRIRWIVAIMGFLAPGGGRFEYLVGASFGKLLTDPRKKQKMIGDCNQIVTYYVYLYSLRFPVTDLEIKLPKDHVCLNFKGLDIEATAGAFANYNEVKKTLPISELISTNLLDVSDFRDKQLEISARDFLNASELAFNLSSERELVVKNLRAACHNVAVDALNGNDYETAEFFAQKLGTQTAEDQALIGTIYHNAIIYFVKEHKFSKARYYLGKSNEGEMRRYIDEQEGAYEFEHGSLSKARELFRSAGNLDMVKATYGKEYNQIQARVAGLRDLETMKSHRSDYEKMLDLARKMEDSSLAENISKILNQL